MTNSITKVYLSKLKKQIPFSSPAKKTFLRTLKQNIENYIAEHPETTYDLVEKNFGTPSEVALSFYETLGQDEVNTHIQSKKRMLWGCCILIAALLLLCGTYYCKLSQSIVYYEFEEIELNTID